MLSCERDGNGATIQRDSSASNFRIFEVAVDGNLTLNNLTIKNGKIVGPSGGNYIHGGSGGGAGLGGGIFNRGALTLNNITIESNTAKGGTGGSGKSGVSPVSGGGFGGSGGSPVNYNNHKWTQRCSSKHRGISHFS